MKRMAIKIKFPSLKIDVQEFFKRLVEKKKFRNVGLFIGREFVDLVELRRSFSGPRLVRFVSIPIHTKPAPEAPQESPPLVPSEEEGLSTHEKLLSAIQRAIRESGLRDRRVVTTLSEEEVIVRYFQMPRLPRKEWNQAVRFEARKYIPFMLEELISDFSVVEDKGEKEKMDVVFVAAKKEVIARHLALITKANLQVTHLEALPFSFMRLLYALDPEAKKEKCICIVDIDGAFGSIILLKEGLPYLIRHVSLEVLREEEIPPSEKMSQETPSFSPIVEKLLDEVRLTSRYYRNQFPGENISRVLVFGEGLNDLPEMLTRELGLPVVAEDLSRVVGSYVPLRLARTIGLGLRGLTAGGSEVELLPPKEVVVPFKQARLLKVLLWEGLGVVIVLFAIFFILTHHVNVQKGVLEEVKRKNRLALVSSLSKEDLEQKKEALSKKKNFYQNLFEKRIFFTKKLSQLGNILPEGAWVTSLQIEDLSDKEPTGEEDVYRLTLKGSVYAPDKTEELKIPSQFLAAIQQNAEFFEGFHEAKLTSVKRDVVEDVSVTSFEILLIGNKR